MKNITSFIFLLFVFSVFVSPASAWWYDEIEAGQQDAYNIIHNARRRGRINQAIADVERYPYGYRRGYNGLVVCDFDECPGLVGTFHAHKKQLHFRPDDPSNRHFSTFEGGAMGAGGGAAIGGATAGKKGAAIVGVIGAVTGGLLASRNQHQNCIVVSSHQEARQRQARVEAQQVQVLERELEEAERREATRWLFNKSGQQAVVTDGGKVICSSTGRCFMRSNENWQVDRPVSGQWEVVLEVPKGAGLVQIPGEVRSVGTRGWEIVGPKEVQ